MTPGQENRNAKKMHETIAHLVVEVRKLWIAVDAHLLVDVARQLSSVSLIALY